MTIWWWILLAACWSLPGLCHVMRAVFDARAAKGEAECQRALAAWRSSLNESAICPDAATCAE